MILTEVPSAYLIGWGSLWMPYAARIARREGCDVGYYLGEALRGESRIFVIRGEDGTLTGAAATRVLLRNNTIPIGELHWLAGDRMREWLPQFVPEVEAILRRDGVQGFKVTGRLGFARALKPYGYRSKKVILEKGV